MSNTVWPVEGFWIRTVLNDRDLYQQRVPGDELEGFRGWSGRQVMDLD